MGKKHKWKEALGDGRKRDKWDGNGSVRGWKKRKEEGKSKDSFNFLESLGKRSFSRGSENPIFRKFYIIA